LTDWLNLFWLLITLLTDRSYGSSPVYWIYIIWLVDWLSSSLPGSLIFSDWLIGLWLFA
jgi:hypothetical protein